MDNRILFYQSFPVFLDNGLFLLSCDTETKNARYRYPDNFGSWGIGATLQDNGSVTLIGDSRWTHHLHGEIHGPASEKDYRRMFDNRSLEYITGRDFIDNILAYATERRQDPQAIKSNT